MWDKKEIDKILMGIHTSVPQEWRAMLFHEVPKTPTTEFIVKEALSYGTLDAQKQEELRRLLDNGHFSQTQKVLDERMAQKIDKFVERKIQHAIKLGKLPSREELETLPFYKEMYAKTASQEKSLEDKSPKGNDL